MVLPDASAGDSVGSASGAIFIPKELDVLLGTLALLELFVDTKLPLRHTVAADKDIVDSGLGHGESCVLFSLCLLDQCDLLPLGGEGPFLRGKPFLHEHHAIDGVGNRFPP